MTAIPKKVVQRFAKQVPKFKRILKQAKDRDINEADTVTIVADILSDVFGYDRYADITSEYAIRNTYCDLAVKNDDTVKYLIEVKSISLDLKESHLRQAVNYGANAGIQWIILTNGLLWKVYNLSFGKAVQYEQIFELDFEQINMRKKEDQEMLFLLAKEGLPRDVIAEYQERIQTVNRHIISAILLNKSALDVVRRELRKLTPGLKVDNDEVENIIRNDIIKRNILEDAHFSEALKRIKKARARAKKKNG